MFPHIFHLSGVILFLPFIVVARQVIQDENMTRITADLCMDESPFVILGYRLNRVYFKYKNELHRSKCVIRRDKSPEVENVRRSTYNGQLSTSVDEYYFNNTINAYFYKATPSMWRLVGLNHAWIGCPQPFCLDPILDAASRYNDTHFAIFRGRYYWIGRGIPAESHTSKKDQILMRGVQYIDAAVFYERKIHMIKNELFHIFTENNSIASGKVDEAYNAATAIGDKVFMFVGNAYSIRRTVLHLASEEYEDIKGTFLEDIEAALYYEKVLYIFKRGLTWSITDPVRSNERINLGKATAPVPSVSLVFGCTIGSYAKTIYKNYRNYKSIMVDMKITSSSTQMPTVQESTSSTYSRSLSVEKTLTPASKASEGINTTTLLVSIGWLAIIVAFVIAFVYISRYIRYENLVYLRGSNSEERSSSHRGKANRGTSPSVPKMIVLADRANPPKSIFNEDSVDVKTVWSNNDGISNKLVP